MLAVGNGTPTLKERACSAGWMRNRARGCGEKDGALWRRCTEVTAADCAGLVGFAVATSVDDAADCTGLGLRLLEKSMGETSATPRSCIKNVLLTQNAVFAERTPRSGVADRPLLVRSTASLQRPASVETTTRSLPCGPATATFRFLSFDRTVSHRKRQIADNGKEN